MKYSNTLVYTKDNDDIYGLIPKIHLNKFNAFTEASGVYHDVIEHWFEGQIKSFQNSNFEKLWGEMVASSIRMYLYHFCSFDPFKLRKYYNNNLDFSIDTIWNIKALFNEDDYTEYLVDNWEPLPINLKKFKNNYYYSLNGEIDDYWDKLIDKIPKSELHSKGIRYTRIRDCYYFGYQLAERMFSKYNRDKVYNQLDKLLNLWYKLLPSNDDPFKDKAPIYNNQYPLQYVMYTVHNNHKDNLTIKGYAKCDGLHELINIEKLGSNMY